MASSSLYFLSIPASSPSSSTVRSIPNPLLPTRFHRTNLKAFSSRRSPYDAVVVTPDARAWVGSRYDRGENIDLDYESEDEEEKEEDRSLDLLVQFLYNVFRNISRKVRRAVRSVLPPSIPSKLVRFSVNGVLILTFLWILKALLEVICTFGSMVFVSILLVRGIWSGVTYIRNNQYYYINPIDPDDQDRWSHVQPAS
ncbi:ATP phosphoribosyltransferase regulatory subunit [Rhynchospora pubera]|uniref:ATP phosphoribosyltransferase regulatory subunit n=1 Tax=Rhynchospora pubera TaxID=906938 RepID=A0AAV8FQB0_9POAL|nr:ATP phosphoribosyltransferase regulatory subunit [Rhynchospora pubera]